MPEADASNIGSLRVVARIGIGGIERIEPRRGIEFEEQILIKGGIVGVPRRGQQDEIVALLEGRDRDVAGLRRDIGISPAHGHHGVGIMSADVVVLHGESRRRAIAGATIVVIVIQAEDVTHFVDVGVGVDARMGAIATSIGGLARAGRSLGGVVHEVVGSPEEGVRAGVVLAVVVGFLEPIAVRPEVFVARFAPRGIVGSAIDQHDAVEVAIAIAVVVLAGFARVIGEIPIDRRFDEVHRVVIGGVIGRGGFVALIPGGNGALEGEPSLGFGLVEGLDRMPANRSFGAEVGGLDIGTDGFLLGFGNEIRGVGEPDGNDQ